MKHLSTAGLFSFFLAILIANPLTSQEATDSTGYPGDHFSLAGALELFKKSDSPEDFEKKLNSKKSQVNNLDLNEDGEIDYIRVEDHMNDDVHAIVLQAPISEKESQDVAVIEIEKTGEETAILQIVGNAGVYGKQMIVEPFEEEGRGGTGGPDAVYDITRVVVNVYFWRPVRFIYRPAYVVYVSPYRWRYYPPYWNPWRPYPYHHYHQHVVVHHQRHYHVTTTHRVTRAHKVYAPLRKSSTVVSTRTTAVKVNKSRNNAAVTRSATTTTQKRISQAQNTPGNKGKSSVSRSTTKAAGKTSGGAVQMKKTTTTTRGKGNQGSVQTKRSTTTLRRKKN